MTRVARRPRDEESIGETKHRCARRCNPQYVLRIAPDSRHWRGVQKGNTTRCAGGTALKFQESVRAWTLRSDPSDQPLAPTPRRRVGARRLQPAAAAATTRYLF